MSQKSYDNSASLYLIPTPIGNLEDITVRSLKMLETVDYILCEDTRTTGSLLKKYHLKNKLVSCHEYNEDKIKNKVVSDLKSGMTIGLVTDQGTPIISDPGYKIVQSVVDSDINVISLPGATAFVPALVISGISPSPFLFYGFLNSKNEKMKKELVGLKNVTATMIFYESTHRIIKMLQNVREVLGDRRVSVSREISKLFEEVYRGSVEDVLSEIDNIKGELVVVVEGNKEMISFNTMTILEHICLYLDDGKDEKEAIKLVAKERNIAKSIVYNEYHKDKEVGK